MLSRSTPAGGDLAGNGFPAAGVRTVGLAGADAGALAGAVSLARGCTTFMLLLLHCFIRMFNADAAGEGGEILRPLHRRNSEGIQARRLGRRLCQRQRVRAAAVPAHEGRPAGPGAADAGGRMQPGAAGVGRGGRPNCPSDSVMSSPSIPWAAPYASSRCMSAAAALSSVAGGPASPAGHEPAGPGAADGPAAGCSSSSESVQSRLSHLE